jgi:hypothetical protein
LISQSKKIQTLNQKKGIAGSVTIELPLANECKIIFTLCKLSQTLLVERIDIADIKERYTSAT